MDSPKNIGVIHSSTTFKRQKVPKRCEREENSRSTG